MRSLVLVVVSYNWRSAVTWVSDQGDRVRGVAIVPFRKDGHHHTPLDYTANNFWKHLAQPVAKVAVSAFSAIALNGKRTTLAALDEEFKRLKAQSGVVWYHRENPASEPHPNATAVVST